MTRFMLYWIVSLRCLKKKLDKRLVRDFEESPNTSLKKLPWETASEKHDSCRVKTYFAEWRGGSKSNYQNRKTPPCVGDQRDAFYDSVAA